MFLAAERRSVDFLSVLVDNRIDRAILWTWAGDAALGKTRPMTTATYRTRAAFVVAGRWTWRTFDSLHGCKHAAIIEHAKSIGATG